MVDDNIFFFDGSEIIIVMIYYMFGIMWFIGWEELVWVVVRNEFIGL